MLIIVITILLDDHKQFHGSYFVTVLFLPFGDKKEVEEERELVSGGYLTVNQLKGLKNCRDKNLSFKRVGLKWSKILQID